MNYLTSPRVKRFAAKTLYIFTALVTILNVSSVGFLAMPQVANAAGNPSANLDQCANDPAPSPSTNGCSGAAGENGWVNGNLGDSKSVYYEGDSIPYRMLFDNLDNTNGNSHTVTIEWDTTKSSKHAIDYLTTYNETVATADPTLGVSGTLTPTTFPIPNDPQVTGAGVTPIAGAFTLFGGTVTGVSAYSYSNGAGFVGDKSASITVTFTADVVNPVLAWGGHISTRTDWGSENSAVAIPGSPYHTRLLDLDGSGGNQDRSLSAAAVVYPASITIIKDATPNSAQSFDYTTTGGLSPASFSLVDNGTAANTHAFTGIIDFTTYSVTESPLAGWALDTVACSVASANGGSQTVNDATVTIGLKEGELVTCTYTNDQLYGTISGYKWKDLNGDGQWQKDTEPGLRDWKILLSTGVYTYTDANGYYAFTGLDASTYTVSEEQKQNWVQTYPAHPNTHSVTLDYGQTVTDVNFGNMPGTCSFSLVKSVDHDTAQPGDVLTYTLDYANTGSADCTGGGTRIDDLIPANTTYVAGSHTETNQNDTDGQGIDFGYIYDKFGSANPTGFNGSLLSWNAHVVSPGESGQVSFQVTVNDLPACTDLSIDNYGTIYANEVPQGIDSNTVSTHVTTACGGTITIIKDVVNALDPNDQTTFDFTLSGTAADTFVLGDNGQKVYTSATAGSYTVSEARDTNYDTQMVCTSDLDGFTYTGDHLANDSYVSFDLHNNESISCTFTNTRNVGALKVRKALDVQGTGQYAIDDTLANSLGFRWGFVGEPTTHLMHEIINPIASGAHTVTENDGAVAGYHFTGWYTTNSVGASQYSCSNPEGTTLPATVTVPERDLVQLVFCNSRDTGDLRIKKYNDLNGNGQKDANEPYLIGWDFTVSQNGQTVATGTTNANDGDFLVIHGLPVGEYVVTETQQSGWVSTDPGTDPITKKVTVTAGTTTDVSFGNFKYGKISGYKFEDRNSNGIWDNGEPTIAGWEINLGGAKTDSTTTDQNGYYEFTGLTAGDYTVTETQQASWTQTTADPNAITMTSGKTVSHVDFGNFHNVTITAYKYEDMNGNGTLDGGDLPIQGWKLTLDGSQEQSTDATGMASWTVTSAGTYTVAEESQTGWVHTSPDSVDVPVTSGAQLQPVVFLNFHKPTVTVTKLFDTDGNLQTTNDQFVKAGWTVQLWQNGNMLEEQQTDQNGQYTWSDLLPGTYTVKEVVPAGYINLGSNEYTFTAISGYQHAYTFYNFELGTISGYKFNDLNGNHAWDNGEPTLAGWKIMLSNGQSTYTDANGYYEFTGLLGGAYSLSEDIQSQNGWVQMVAPSSVTVTTGTDSTHNDFGNTKLASITAKKLIDADGSLQTTGDQTVKAGWTVQLWLNGNQYGGDQVTDATGTYTWSNLLPGDYTVKEIFNSDDYTALTATEYHITIQSGDQKLATFINFENIDVTVCKYIDANGDGDLTGDSVYTAGWDVYLNQLKATTSRTGCYTYEHVGPGHYTVTEENVAGWTQTYPAAPGTYQFDAVSGQDTSYDFGNFEQPKIKVRKLIDADGSLQTTGDQTAKQGWAVDLYHNGQFVETQVTDANGYYIWSNLQPGTYKVVEHDLTGYTALTPTEYEFTVSSGDFIKKTFINFENIDVTVCKYVDANGDGDLTGDSVYTAGWDVYLNQTQATTDENGCYTYTDLGPGTYDVSEANVAGWTQTYPAAPGTYQFDAVSGQDTSYDFGNFKDVTIKAYKYNDLNGNGVLDQGEPAIKDWKMYLDGGQEQLTDANGMTSWIVHHGGDYTVSEDDATGWTHTNANSVVVNVQSGDQDKVVNFLNFENVDITVCKYIDDNGDGDISTDSVYTAGWDVYLNQTKATTEQNGCYTYTNVGPGSYTVTEDTSNADWIQTYPLAGSYAFDTISGQDVTYNFGNFELGTITGFKFEDVNNDGIWGSTQYGDENGLAGWEINLWDDNAGQPGQIIDTTTTDQFGRFEFSNLPAGTYWLSETLQPGWAQFAPASGVFGPIVVTSGYDNNNQEDYFEFGNAEKPTLDIEKYNDQEVLQGGDGLVAPNEVVNYTIDWSVSGNSITTNVVLVDHIPAELTIDTASITSTMATINGTPTWDPTARTITWDFGTQQPNASGTVTYTATVNLPLDNGTPIINVARLSADNADPDYAEDDSVVTVASAPILHIDKVVDLNNELGFVNPGDTVTYTITVWNTGTETAYNTQLSDLLPDGFTYDDVPGSVRNWSLGDLVPGADPVVVTYDVTVSEDQAAGFYDNVAVTWADNHGNVDDDATVEVRVPSVLSAEPELTIEKTVKETFINPGDTVTYTVVVTNIGEATAFNVMLQDVLPAGFTFDSGSITKSWNLGDINPEESRTVTYTVNTNKALLAGDYENVAVTWADNHGQVSDFASVEVRKPQVLAAEDLPVTGGNMLLWLYSLGALIVFAFAGWMLRMTAAKQK